MVGRLLGIDAGTTGVTVLAVDEQGRVAARGYREFAQRFPRPGWVEHDPEDWWEAMLAAATEALAAAETDARDLLAVGIATQRETTVVWDRATLQPIHPAIVWQDRRTADLCRTLREEGWAERVAATTGLVVDPYFSATKLAWILEAVDDARERAEAGELAFGTVDAYLMSRLTGGASHVMDRTNASRTMLFDIHRLAWFDELLERLRIPHQVLPGVVGSLGTFGMTDPDRFLGARLPIAGLAGDQQAALFGQACFGPGATKNTYGTGSFVLMHTGSVPPASRSGLVTTLACGDADPEYALEGSIFVTGAAIQWLRDGLGLIREAAEAGPVAVSVPDSGGVVFVPALTGLGAPWWDPEARGVLIGLSRGTSGAHVIRAAVEAIAYQTRDVVDAMASDAPAPISELRVDGGASAMDVMLQYQADLLGVPVRRAAVLDSTALGAAYLAGLGEEMWTSTDEVGALWRSDRDFEPGDRDRADEGYRQWRRAVERALGWAVEGPASG
jgi:glycerol kinase